MTTDDRPCPVCSRPLHNTDTICDHCADQLHRALGDVPWLAEQLAITATGSKGIDYRALGSTANGDPAEAPMPINLAASNAHDHLKTLLVSWTLMCHSENLPHQSPSDDLPADNLPSISRWLMWRINALQHHDAGPDAVEEITAAVRRAQKVIDKQPPKQYLGGCTASCPGSIYALYDGSKAWCDTCNDIKSADTIRREQIKALEPKLMTSHEIATYASGGDDRERDRIRNRIDQWRKREKIEPVTTNPPRYLFETVWKMLNPSEQHQS